MVGYFDTLSDYDFVQLISGVVWLVRNGTNNVKAAIETEYDGVQGKLLFPYTFLKGPFRRLRLSRLC